MAQVGSNLLKGCDLHIYPWGTDVPSWLNAMLDRIQYHLF
jgi:hypothetical protein